jgi:acyl-coenzyme A synthetase/AMP-(fatty) acid ligase/pimeloyl-ACP methyl ester carboxylesterase
VYGNWFWFEHQFLRNSLVTMTAPSAQLLGEIGLDPSWSHTVEVLSHDEKTHRWHYLDRPGLGDSAPTVLCLHGNPTWSYLWSRLLHELNAEFRVIAPDHLSMGYSEQVGARRYRDRVADIKDFVDALGISGPIWLVAQDWGGAIAIWYAVAHPEKVAGLVLSNTGIAVPEGRKAPRLIQISASGGLHRTITRNTSLFVRGTAFLPGAGLSKQQRQGLVAPYMHRNQRDGIGGFVADVPFNDKHESFKDIAQVAAQLPNLNVPVRLWWGAKDPVFNDDFADDLIKRLSDVQIHRVANSGHLAVLETSIATFVENAISQSGSINPQAVDATKVGESLWSRIESPSRQNTLAIYDGADKSSVKFSELDSRVASFAQGLIQQGVHSGDRVAVLVPPSIDLIALVYACWRIGAVTVIADRGLGIKGLGRAVKSSRVQHVVGVRAAVVAARTLRWAARATFIDLKSLQNSMQLEGLSQLALAEPVANDLAAILFTSGATGPAKGVRYTHGQLGAQRDILQAVYNITDTDSFVAAFAPFALFGPALGITTGLADMDVTSPATLTAQALDDACRATEATMVFASPAALANVLKTSTTNLSSLKQVQLVMSAGAPVPIETLRQMTRLCPQAEMHTPYGMTEVLPVADLSLEQREAVGEGAGVCVGKPVNNCRVKIVAVDDGVTELPHGETGEVVVSAPWMSLGYNRLWLTQQKARFVSDGLTWHRTGDVGHLDSEGHVWIEGRVVHMIHTAQGSITPVPLETVCEMISGVQRAAAVGIGEPGIQQIVIVLETDEKNENVASAALTAQVRQALGLVDVVAVWETKKLPVDIRHNSKIDRTALGQRMQKVLSGRSK